MTELGCIGIDLAWSPRNPTGIAAIRGTPQQAHLREAAIVQTMDEIVAFVVQHTADLPAVVAVDAPLRVPNEQGRRAAEAALGRVFARYQAGPHPANRARLAIDGVVRGEELVQRLAAHGFHESDGKEVQAVQRPVVEVYPHAAMIALFGLPRTLKYKYKPQYSTDFRLAEWHRYQQHMRELATADPALHGHSALLAQEVGLLRGRQRKHYEDQVDALLCAYIGLYLLRWGQARCRTFGTLATGCIVVPVPSEYSPSPDPTAPAATG